jgi:hypothetical protein
LDVYHGTLTIFELRPPVVLELCDVNQSRRRHPPTRLHLVWKGNRGLNTNLMCTIVEDGQVLPNLHAREARRDVLSLPFMTVAVGGKEAGSYLRMMSVSVDVLQNE